MDELNLFGVLVLNIDMENRQFSCFIDKKEKRSGMDRRKGGDRRNDDRREQNERGFTYQKKILTKANLKQHFNQNIKSPKIRRKVRPEHPYPGI